MNNQVIFVCYTLKFSLASITLVINILIFQHYSDRAFFPSRGLSHLSNITGERMYNVKNLFLKCFILLISIHYIRYRISLKINK